MLLSKTKRYFCHQISKQFLMTLLKKFLPWVLVVFVVLAIGCKKDDDDNKEPKAAFTWQLTDSAGQVIFTNTSENAQTFEWNFGDGTASTATSPMHLYEENDSFIVTLKAFGIGSNSVQDTVLVNNLP
jgi:PKD repeat protein